jgi:hypothetical protein
MDIASSLPVLVVHPVLRVARRNAAELVQEGFLAVASDSLEADYNHPSIAALVLYGSAQCWIDAEDERTLPPTVLVGGDVFGVVRAAGASKCPEGASAAMVGRALRSLIRLSDHSRGRGTMPMRVTSSCVCKVSRWMTVPRFSAFDDDYQTCHRDLRPTAH